MLSPKAVYKIVQAVLSDTVVENYDKDFSCRLLVQKAIFAFQELNNFKGFEYSWYLAGPYSAELTSAFFEKVISAPQEERSKWDAIDFNDKGRLMIDKVKRYYSCSEAELEPINLSVVDWYELMASCLFLRSRHKDLNTRDRLAAKLRKLKDRFSAEQVSYVVDKYWDRAA